MTSSKITPTGKSLDLSNVDIDAALQRGRRLRAEAFTSVLKSLFRGQRAERGQSKSTLSPDCAAPA